MGASVDSTMPTWNLTIDLKNIKNYDTISRQGNVTINCPGTHYFKEINVEGKLTIKEGSVIIVPHVISVGAADIQGALKHQCAETGDILRVEKNLKIVGEIDAQSVMVGGTVSYSPTAKISATSIIAKNLKPINLSVPPSEVKTTINVGGNIWLLGKERYSQSELDNAYYGRPSQEFNGGREEVLARRLAGNHADRSRLESYMRLFPKQQRSRTPGQNALKNMQVCAH